MTLTSDDIPTAAHVAAALSEAAKALSEGPMSHLDRVRGIPVLRVKCYAFHALWRGFPRMSRTHIASLLKFETVSNNPSQTKAARQTIATLEAAPSETWWSPVIANRVAKAVRVVVVERTESKEAAE